LKRKRDVDKKKSSLKYVHPAYDETIQFIESYATAGNQKQAAKEKPGFQATREFYSDSFIDDYSMENDREEELDRDDSDSDYFVEDEERKGKEPITAPFDNEETYPQNMEVIDLIQQDNTNIQGVQRVSQAITIQSDEISKEKAKSIHKVFYDNCLFKTQDQKLIYNQQLGFLKKDLTDLQVLWTLCNLCFNFIVNLSFKIRTTIQEKEEFHQELLQFQKEDAEGQSEFNERKQDIIERLQYYQETSLIYFEQIEKAGTDIFNLIIPRLKKGIKNSPIQISNRKKIKQQLEQLALQVNVISLEISDQLKFSRKLLETLLNLFEMMFHLTLEEALLPDDEKEEDDNDNEVESEIRTFPEHPSKKKPRIRDISAEAATTKRTPKFTLSSDDEDDLHSDDDKPEVLFIAPETTTRQKKSKSSTTPKTSQNKSSHTTKLKFIDLTKDYQNRMETVMKKRSISSRTEFLDFIDSEDEFELLNLQPKSQRRHSLESKGIRKYFEKYYNTRNPTIDDETNLKLNDSRKVEISKKRFTMFYEKDSGASGYYHRVNPVVNPNAICDGRVILLEYSDFVNAGEAINKTNGSGLSSSNRLSDAILNSTIPSLSMLAEIDSTLRNAKQRKKGQEEAFFSESLPLQTEEQEYKEELNENQSPFLQNEKLSFQFFSLYFSVFRQLSSFDESFSFTQDFTDKLFITNFLSQLWNSITFSSTEMVVINDNFLFLPFPEKWKVFQNYFLCFLKLKLVYYHQLNSRKELFQFINKIRRIIFSKEMELFFLSKESTNAQGKTDGNQTSVDFIEKIFFLSNEIEKELFHTLFPGSGFFQISDILFILFPSSSYSPSSTTDSSDLILILVFYISKYQWVYSILCRSVLVINNQPSEQSLQHSLVLIDFIVYNYFQFFFEFFLLFFKENPSALLIFSYSLLQFFEDPPVDNGKMSQQDRDELLLSSATADQFQFFLFIQLIYQAFYFEEKFLKFVQQQLTAKASNMTTVNWKDLFGQNKLQNKYLLLKYSERMNYHLSNISLFNSLSSFVSCFSQDRKNLFMFSLEKCLKLSNSSKHHFFTAVKRYSTPSFAFQPSPLLFGVTGKDGKLSPEEKLIYKSNHEQQKTSYEFIWNILILSSNISFSVLTQDHTGNEDLFQQSPRISNNWFLIKYLFQQLNKQMDQLSQQFTALQEPKNRDEKKIALQNHFKKELAQLTRLLFSSFHRLNKFALFWDNPIDAIDLFFVTFEKAVDLFDYYSPSLQTFSDINAHGLIMRKEFTAKTLLIISHYCYEYHNFNALKHNSESSLHQKRFITQRGLLHEKLLVVVNYLFASNGFTSIFAPSSASTKPSRDTANGSSVGYSCSDLLLSFQTIFKELLMNLLIVLNPKTDSTSQEAIIQFDFISFRKLKSMVLKNKKKILDIYSRKKFFSVALLALLFIKELYHVFREKIVTQEMNFIAEIFTLLIETQLESPKIDQRSIATQDLNGNDDTNRNQSENYENQRSLLLLTNSLIIFNPLNIEIEFKFVNQPKQQQQSSFINTLFDSDEVVSLQEDDFLLFIKSQLEYQQKNLTSLNSFLNFFKLFSKIIRNGFQEKNFVLLKKMENIFYSALSSSFLILSHWLPATNMSENAAKHHSTTDQETDNSDGSRYSSNFKINHLPFEVILENLQLIYFYLAHLMNSSVYSAPLSNNGNKKPANLNTGSSNNFICPSLVCLSFAMDSDIWTNERSLMRKELNFSPFTNEDLFSVMSPIEMSRERMDDNCGRMEVP
jgi:hypothetical protein